MNAAEEKTVLSGAAGTGSYRYAVLSPTFFLLAVVVALVSGVAALASPTSVSANALCTPQNRVWGNCGSATRQKFRNTVRPAQREHLAFIGQIQWQATTRTHITSGFAGGATAIPARRIEIPSTFQQLVIYPIRPTASHFGRDPPVQLTLNPRYNRSTRYAAAVSVFVAAKEPPLERLHPDTTYEKGSAKLSLESVRKMSTEEIIKSLKPGAESPLSVKPNGKIVQGNTRIKVLQERGVDVNSLPRTIHKPDNSETGKK